MNKLKFFFTSSLIGISLFGCNNQIPNNLIQQNSNIQNTVASNKTDPSIKTVQNFYDFIKVLHKKEFQAYDINKDNQITKDEFIGLEEYFIMMDLDKNGKITFKEATSSKFLIFDDTLFWQEVYQNLFKWMDINEDGFASNEEFLNFFLTDPPNPSPAKIKYFKTLFSKNDVNKDNKHDFSEFEDAQSQLWKRDIVVKILSNGAVYVDLRGYQ
jgi:Ca2+-binding EF-hand superfamily protein